MDNCFVKKHMKVTRILQICLEKFCEFPPWILILISFRKKHRMSYYHFCSLQRFTRALVLWTLDTPAGDVGAVVKVIEADRRQLDGVDLPAHPDRFGQPNQRDVVCKNVVLVFDVWKNYISCFIIKITKVEFILYFWRLKITTIGSSYYKDNRWIPSGAIQITRDILGGFNKVSRDIFLLVQTIISMLFDVKVLFESFIILFVVSISNLQEDKNVTWGPGWRGSEKCQKVSRTIWIALNDRTSFDAIIKWSF